MDFEELNIKRGRFLELVGELKSTAAWLDKHDRDLNGYIKHFNQTMQELGFQRLLNAAAQELNIERLQLATLVGGPLYEGAHASATALREYSRAWRNLIEGLRQSSGSPKRTAAEHALELIGVHHWKGNCNALHFATIKK